jgi:hypothetical protein
MGQVILFRRLQPSCALRRREKALLECLCDSSEIVWLGGWALPASPRGVMLICDLKPLGVWTYDGWLFTFRSNHGGLAAVDVASTDAAYTHSLTVLKDACFSPRNRSPQ